MAKILKKYKQACDRCARDLEPSRSTVHSVVFWLHDGVYTCKAAQLREKDYNDKLKRESKVG